MIGSKDDLVIGWEVFWGRVLLIFSTTNVFTGKEVLLQALKPIKTAKILRSHTHLLNGLDELRKLNSTLSGPRLYRLNREHCLNPCSLDTVSQPNHPVQGV